MILYQALIKSMDTGGKEQEFQAAEEEQPLASIDRAIQTLLNAASNPDLQARVGHDLREKLLNVIAQSEQSEKAPDFVAETAQPLIEKDYNGTGYEELLRLMEMAGLLSRGTKNPWKGGGYVWEGNGMRFKEKIFGRFGQMLDTQGYEPFQIPRQLPKEIIDAICAGVVDLEKGTYWLAEVRDKVLRHSGLYANSSNDAVVSYWLANKLKSGGKVLPFRGYSRHQIIRSHADSINTKALLNSDENTECNEAYSIQETTEACEAEFQKIIRFMGTYFDEMGVAYLTVDQSNWGNKPVARKVTSFQTYAGPVRGSVRLATIYMHDTTFSSLFGLETKSPDGSVEPAHQVGYGLWEGLIIPLLEHLTDKHGLCTPPHLAAKQVIFVVRNPEEEKKAQEIIKQLDDPGRATIDTVYNKRYVKRLNSNTKKGYPLRVTFSEDGEDLMFSRRDTLKSHTLSPKEFISTVPHLLSSIAANYRKRSKEYMEAHIAEAEDMREINKLVKQQKLVTFNHCGEDDCAIEMEKKLTGEFLGHTREHQANGCCIGCGNKGKLKGLFGRRAPTP
jgi:prolyl-tRNA synthetase